MFVKFLKRAWLASCTLYLGLSLFSDLPGHKQYLTCGPGRIHSPGLCGFRVCGLGHFCFKVAPSSFPQEVLWAMSPALRMQTTVLATQTLTPSLCQQLCLPCPFCKGLTVSHCALCVPKGVSPLTMGNPEGSQAASLKTWSWSNLVAHKGWHWLRPLRSRLGSCPWTQRASKSKAAPIPVLPCFQRPLG